MGGWRGECISFLKSRHSGRVHRAEHPASVPNIFRGFVQPHSRFLRPVALVVDGCGDADHNGREEVTGHVVVLLPGVFALKDLDQHEVQLDPLEAHPGEGSQEEEVEDPGDDGTTDLGFRCRREEK